MATITGNPTRAIRRYTPPDGFDDLPFTYVFNGDDLVDGTDARNQLVYIEGGLGDFILRRVVGLDTVVNPVGGQFQIEDDFLRYIQADPVFVNGGGELPIVPELRYRELGAIRFDLYNVLVLDPPIFPQFTFQNSLAGRGGGAGGSDQFGLFLTPIQGPDPSNGGAPGVTVANSIGVMAALPDGSAPGYMGSEILPSNASGWETQLDLISGTGVIATATMGQPAFQGNTAVIGFQNDTTYPNGSAFACVRDMAGNWSIQQQLIPGDTAPQGNFGSSCGVFGNIAVVLSAVGSGPAIYVYQRTGTVWTQIQQFQPPVASTVVLSLGAMTISQLFIVGVDSVTGTGKVYVYTFNSGAFQLVQTLAEGGGNDFFGISVSSDGTTLVIGGGLSTTGLAYVYIPGSGGTWSLSQTLVGSDTVSGDDFGYGVAVSGALMVIGARNASVGAVAFAGAAYVFIYSGGVFYQSQKLTAPTPTTLTYFGWSTAAFAGNKSWVAIGAPALGNVTFEGHVYFYQTGFIDAFSVFKSQIAFQGVRRVRHIAPKEPTYKYKPKFFVYTLPVTIDVLGLTAGQPTAPITVYQNISDYDFDLYALMFTYVGAQGPLPLNTFYTKLWLYDSVKHQLSNLPVLDLYYNGAPGSKFQNGAIVPTLFYPQEAQIRVDIFSLLADAAVLPVTMTIHFIGRQRYPC
jgi:FG-GAP repeat